MKKKYVKITLFLLLVICALASQFFIQQRYTSLLQGGREYQWPVTLDKPADWIPTDYLHVNFLGNTVKWTGPIMPKEGDTIYITLDVKPTGLLSVKGASYDKPSDGEYIIGRVKKAANGVVEFSIPFDRVQVDLAKVNPEFYHSYRGTLIATLKIKDGRGVVTGVYSKGVSIENAYPASLAEQAKDNGITIEELLKSINAEDSSKPVVDGGEDSQKIPDQGIKGQSKEDYHTGMTSEQATSHAN